MTNKKITLPLFLFFLIGVSHAYTPVYNDIVSTVTGTVQTLVNALIPFWAIFLLGLIIFLIIKTLGG